MPADDLPADEPDAHAGPQWPEPGRHRSGPGAAPGSPPPAPPRRARHARPGDDPGFEPAYPPPGHFVERDADTPPGAPDGTDRLTQVAASGRWPWGDEDGLPPGSRPPPRAAHRADGPPAELSVDPTAETVVIMDEPVPPASEEHAEQAAGREPVATGRGNGHGHGHGHGPARPAGRRVQMLLAALLVPCALATLIGLVLLWPTGTPTPPASVTQQPVRAQVTDARASDCSQGSGEGGCVTLILTMADGPRAGRNLVQVVPVEPGSPRFAVGDQVILGWSGADPDDAGSYQVVDFQRGAPLAWLAGLFAGAVLLLGRWRGLAALAALALSFLVLAVFVLPAILAGRDPLAVAIVGSCVIMFVVLYLTHGPSARTSTAVLGTLLSLALIGALGTAFSAAARLTGLDDQTSNLIASLGSGVDARGLLLAGVVIGALGVLDDVTVTQTSAVWELHHANPRLGMQGLFAAAMRIGRDHVASAVNTLVLAYAGAALPLMLLFTLSGRGLGDVLTTQDVATEIVRTLVGSIGLVASVPITTALAAAVAVREDPNAPTDEPDRPSLLPRRLSLGIQRRIPRPRRKEESTT